VAQEYSVTLTVEMTIKTDSKETLTNYLDKIGVEFEEGVGIEIAEQYASDYDYEKINDDDDA